MICNIRGKTQGMFRIQNADKFVKESMDIPRVEIYKYIYHNSDDNLIRLIGAMGATETDQIMQMLNGDAIGTAASTLGIKTDSISDIFSKIMDKKYVKYNRATAVIAFADTICELAMESGDHYDYSAEQLTSICRLIRKRDSSVAELIRGESDPLFESIDNLIAAQREIFNNAKIAIDRVKENIKEGCCQVCCSELTSYDVFIMKCCGVIVCDLCGVKSSHFKKTAAKDDYKKQHILGNCCNCKAVINIADLIFVDRTLDINTLVSCSVTETTDESVLEDVVANDADEEGASRPNPKLDALLSIYKTGTALNCEPSTIVIDGLVIGKRDTPGIYDANHPRKMIVFAGFGETLAAVGKFLTESGISWLQLCGTHSQKARTIAEFEKSGQVLLINSSQTCAGVNLQYCSDAVFMHKISDPNIEAQVAGRIQRIGRTCNARIHYLAYDNEGKKV